MIRPLHLSLLGLCLILFTSLATTDLALPGPQYDEVQHTYLAIDLMHPPHPYSKEYHLHIGPQPLPFGVDPHTGALKAYLLWPLFALFGPSVPLMRLFTIFLGLLVLLFFYLFAKECFDPWSAFFATLLLSLDSSFIFYSKLDVGSIMEQLLWMMGGLLSFTQWHKTQKLPYLLLSLLSGLLGIYSHIAFIWVLLAGSFAFWLVSSKEFKELFIRKDVPWVALFSSVSGVIFLYWFIGGYLIGDLQVSKWHRSPYLFQIAGISDLFSMFERLSRRAGVIPEVLIGHEFGKSRFSMTVRPLTDFFFVGTIFFLLAYYRTKRTKLFFFFLLAGCIQIALTPYDLAPFPHRMMLFYLFLPLLSGVALSRSGLLLRFPQNHSTGKRIAAAVVIILYVVSLTQQILITKEAIQRIRTTGGKGYWSSASYSFSSYLESQREKKVICLNMELRRILFVLTKGNMFFGEAYDPEKLKRELPQLRVDKTIFVMYSGHRTLFGLYPEEFEKVVAVEGYQPYLDRTFQQSDGKVLYLVYRIKPL